MARITSVLVPHSKFASIGSIGVLVLILLFWSMRQLHRDQVSSRYGTAPEMLPVSTKDERRPLVLYTYAESENARANLEFFIKKALHGAADFFFVFNGETNATELIPYEPNIKIIQRENRCFDLGTIGEVLLKDDLWRKYKRFITLNASIRGPFFPIYSSNSCWTDVFLDRVTEHVKVLDSFLCPK